MNMTMNVRVPQKAGNLSNWATISFSRRNQSHRVN